MKKYRLRRAIEWLRSLILSQAVTNDKGAIKGAIWILLILSGLIIVSLIARSTPPPQ